MAFAAIAGLPPEYGLYTAMIPPIIAALFGSSLVMVSGPTTAISAVVFSALAGNFTPGSTEFVSAAILLALLVGVIQLAFALARVGRLAGFVSHSVMIGFTAAAALLIFVSQLGPALGLVTEKGHGIVGRLSALLSPLVHGGLRDQPKPDIRAKCSERLLPVHSTNRPRRSAATSSVNFAAGAICMGCASVVHHLCPRYGSPKRLLSALQRGLRGPFKPVAAPPCMTTAPHPPCAARRDRPQRGKQPETPMKIATFNINGIKARYETLLRWLDESAPDIALLQEIKSVDENFPRAEIEDKGYNVETHGQKSFNGVAILSKYPLEDVSRGLPGDDTDEQARWIEATVTGDRQSLRICGLYLPNGNPVPGPKYDYKLAWMARLKARAEALLAAEMPALMAGDYNIIPQAEDAARPDAWREDALFRPASRAAFREVLNLGMTEAFRARTHGPGHYSFWDYQASAWQRNDGIRIDHFLLTPQCADLLRDCWIESEMRGREKPSDHVPVWVDLDA